MMNEHNTTGDLNEEMSEEKMDVTNPNTVKTEEGNEMNEGKEMVDTEEEGEESEEDTN